MTNYDRLREQKRTQEAQTRAAVERMIGDPKPFGCYDDGCPKCGTPKRSEEGLHHKPNYCFGEQKLIEEAPCKIPGEHLHTVCAACGHVWLQRCKDWDPNADPERKYIVGIDPAVP